MLKTFKSNALNTKQLQIPQRSLSTLRNSNHMVLHQTYIQVKIKQRNTHYNQMRPHTLPTFQSANPSRSTLLPQRNQISRHFTCMVGPIAYYIQ